MAKFQNPSTKFKTLSIRNAGFDVPKKSDKK
jgi:hypothetical protein